MRFAIDGDSFRMSELALDGTWGESLQGTFQPRNMDDFTPRSEFLKTEPGLAWTQRQFATRATAPDGSRITLRNGVLRVREGCGEFVDTPVDDSQFDALLSEHFQL